MISLPLTPSAAAASRPETLRFAPAGYREAPKGATLVMPPEETGVDRRYLVPRKPRDGGIAQIMVESRPDEGRLTATRLLQARYEAYAQRCPGATNYIPEELDNEGFRVALSVVHCKNDPVNGFGRVLYTKAIVGGERVHLIEIAYHHPVQESGEAQTGEKTIDEAIGMLSQSKVCYGRGDDDCRIQPDQMMAEWSRELTAEEAAEVARVEALGSLLYRHDQLAWHGTDALSDRNFDLAGLQSTGWLTRIVAGEPNRLVYAGMTGGVPVGIVEVAYDSTPPSVTDLKRTPLAGEWLAAFKALDRTRNERNLFCANGRNMVSFPDPAGKGWLVYWMSATDQPDLLVSGGHTRYLVSADGSNILGQQAMTKSCMEMPVKDGRDGQRVAVIALTHLVTDLPTEVHVFNSLLHKVPIVIFASSGTWRASAGKLVRIY